MALSSSIHIEFVLPIAKTVILKVYDMLGREIATPIDNERIAGGTHQVVFDAGNYASGIYYYRLKAGDFVKMKKMLLIK